MDDRFIVLYYLASDGIVVERIDKYMYMFQKFGFDMQYRFKVSVNGTVSKPFRRYLEDEISKGNLVVKDNTLYCSYEGLDLFNGVCFSLDEVERMDILIEALDKLTLQDLEMLVVIDIVMNDVDRQGGVNALMKQRDTIEKLVGNVCSTYTPSKFVYLVGFLNELELIMNN